MTVRTQGGRFADAGGLRIHYEEHGTGHPVVLVHGGLLTGRLQWGPHLRALSRSFRVVVPDSRGHGKTANPDGRLDYAQMADDLASFVGALGLERPMIVGYSDGGQIALELALRHPDVPRALVIGAASFRFSADYRDAIRAWVGPADNPEVDTARLEREDLSFVRFARSAQGDQGPEHWKVLMQQLKPAWVSSPNHSTEQLSTVPVPALVLLGDRDHFFPVEDAVALYRMLPNAELFIAPGCDHFSAVNTSTMRVVADFLRRAASADEPDTRP